MTTEGGVPAADPADVAEQQQDVSPVADEQSVPAGSDEVPWDADEADVAEQRREVTGDQEDDEG